MHILYVTSYSISMYLQEIMDVIWQLPEYAKRNKLKEPAPLHYATILGKHQPKLHAEIQILDILLCMIIVCFVCIVVHPSHATHVCVHWEPSKWAVHAAV